MLQPILLLVYAGENPNWRAPKWSDCFDLPEPLRDGLVTLPIYGANVTGMFHNNALVGEPMVRFISEIMARAGSGRLNEDLRPLFQSLNSSAEWTEKEQTLFQACLLYVILAKSNSGVRMTENELLTLSGDIDFVEGKKMGSLLYGHILHNDQAKIEEKAREQGIEQGIELVATNLINLGTPFDTIARATGLSLAQIQTLAGV